MSSQKSSAEINWNHYNMLVMSFNNDFWFFIAKTILASSQFKKSYQILAFSELKYFNEMEKFEQFQDKLIIVKIPLGGMNKQSHEFIQRFLLYTGGMKKINSTLWLFLDGDKYLISKLRRKKDSNKLESIFDIVGLNIQLVKYFQFRFNLIRFKDQSQCDMMDTILNYQNQKELAPVAVKNCLQNNCSEVKESKKISQISLLIFYLRANKKMNFTQLQFITRLVDAFQELRKYLRTKMQTHMNQIFRSSNYNDVLIAILFNIYHQKSPFCTGLEYHDFFLQNLQQKMSANQCEICSSSKEALFFMLARNNLQLRMD